MRLFFFLLVSPFTLPVTADEFGEKTERVTVDVYVRPESTRCQDVCVFLKKLAKQRGGLDVVVHDVMDDLTARRRLYALGKRHGVSKMGLPAVHVMDRFRVGYSNTEAGQKKLESLLTIEVFTRSGCPHCRDAKAYLRVLALRWPAIRFDIRDIVTDVAARERMMKLASHYRVHASSVPAFHLCGKLKIGYLGPATTGREIEDIIRQAARSQKAESPPSHQPGRNAEKQTRQSSRVLRRHILSSTMAVFVQPSMRAGHILQFPVTLIQPPENSEEMDPLPDLDFDDLEEMEPLPELGTDTSAEFDDVATLSEEGGSESMNVPLFGKLSASELGMPVFTFLIGLVDGFNPCAMWVLMFLLSVLVNIKERRKILVIAGTFVFVSGLAYYAFMAAWLNVFMLVGMNRPAQVILGWIAIVIGVVNVKDFFAFGKGLSFKIPEAAKPGIYSRVRKILAEKHLWAALFGAIVLAVLVNMVELLCTAGLPAMYTKILSMQGYSPLVNYAYLGLYIVAYMLDDSLMVAIVVVTLSKKKLQETEGRWLKLISGLVILALGIVMIVKPDLLV